MSSLGDRRTSVRFEIVGSLWGTLQLTEAARVVDISPGGALIVSPVAMAIDSVGPVKLTLGNEEVTVDARVRHFRPVSGADGGDAARYLIGLEFATVPPALAQALE
jgi:hypothetical protein